MNYVQKPPSSPRGRVTFNLAVHMEYPWEAPELISVGASPSTFDSFAEVTLPRGKLGGFFSCFCGNSRLVVTLPRDELGGL